MMNLTKGYKKPSRGLAIVWSVLATLPYPGITWHRMQFLAGLRRLGFDVWYVEAMDIEMLTPDKFWKCVTYEKNIEYLSRHMELLGMQDRWFFKTPWQNESTYGATDMKGLERLYEQADIVINHTGAQVVDERHDKIKCLVYLETDPVESQIKVYNEDKSTIEMLSKHQYHFTFGTNIGTYDFNIPVKYFNWIPILPAICVDWWSNNYKPAPPFKFSTVATFKHQSKDATYNETPMRWSKHSQFEAFKSLPKMVNSNLELCLGGTRTSGEEVDKLVKHGWAIKNARELDDIFKYRKYITESSAEFTIAKEQYVSPCSGWFSDRSATYLAAGRPVVTQSTGFERTIPTGLGLFGFETREEAACAIDEISSDYEKHSKAAREIAHEYFATEKVLSKILEKSGLS